MEKLTEKERQYAEQNHNIVYWFLRKNNYDIEDFYSIAVFGYLKAVQIYNRRTDLQQKYEFAFIAQQYMRSEVGNYFTTQNSQKRKSEKGTVSFDVECMGKENLYNVMGTKSVEDNMTEMELFYDIMGNLSDLQRKIVLLKMDGYNNKEVAEQMAIKHATYYRELKRIRASVENILDR